MTDTACIANAPPNHKRVQAISSKGQNQRTDITLKSVVRSIDIIVRDVDIFVRVDIVARGKVTCWWWLVSE